MASAKLNPGEKLLSLPWYHGPVVPPCCTLMVTAFTPCGPVVAPAAAVAVPDTVREPLGLATVDKVAGEVTAVDGAAPLPPPRPKSYRKPSSEVTRNVPSKSAGDAVMKAPVW